MNKDLMNLTVEREDGCEGDDDDRRSKKDSGPS